MSAELSVDCRVIRVREKFGRCLSGLFSHLPLRGLRLALAISPYFVYADRLGLSQHGLSHLSDD